MPDSRPNIVLFITDQQRGDCLGVDGHPVQQTPYLDNLASDGVRFENGYTACPVCIPARRTLMSGQRPAGHGVLMNYNTLLHGPTLPGELAANGYQAHLVGKLHLWPHRKRYGFQSEDWADSPRYRDGGDYVRWLRRHGIHHGEASTAHGGNVNGWVARPWHLEERFHFTNWCADMALDFLERRDPTAPFFMKVSFHQPHQPCVPPQCYYDRYMNMDLPEPYCGDWAKVYDGPQRGLPVCSWKTALDPQVMKQYRAGYFGCINHIDDQIGRILMNVPRNTIVLFVSDHGEMLGDHQWIRKRSAYEGSARVPYIWKFPAEMGIEPGQVRDEVVELMDVMPTLLDAAGCEIPDSVDGQSFLPLLRGRSSQWREHLHGECADVPGTDSGQQWFVTPQRKYIWHPGTGVEQYFDLENDPKEMHEVSGEARYASEIEHFRSLMVKQLEGRPEGFSDGKELKVIGGSSAFCLPGYEQEDQRI